MHLRMLQNIDNGAECVGVSSVLVRGVLADNFDLMVASFSWTEVLNKEENRKLGNVIVNHGVKSLDKHDSEAGTASYPSAKVLFEYMEADCGQVWSAKRTAEVDVWSTWISALLNLHSGKGEEVWITNTRDRFLIKGRDCLQRCGHKGLEVVEPGGNRGSFMIVIRRESSSLWPSP